MKLEGQKGSQDLGSAAWGPFRLATDGSLVTLSSTGRLTEAALAGRLFSACNETHVTTNAHLNNTFTGLAIVNPSTTGKNYIFHEFNYALDNSPSADTNLSLAIGPEHAGFVGGTTITVRCAFWGQATSGAVASVAATITGASGANVKHIATLGTNITTDLLTPTHPIDLGGQIIIPPGYALYTNSLLGSGAFMYFGFVWEEVDV